MNKEELFKEIKRECHLGGAVEKLISRATVNDEEIFGKYAERSKYEIEEGKIKSMKYNYYFVTDCKFLRIFVSDLEYWYKTCSLNRFLWLEEKNLPAREKIIQAVDVNKALFEDGFPGELEIGIYFDLDDKDLSKIRFKSGQVTNKAQIKNFGAAVVTAVSGLHKKSKKL